MNRTIISMWAIFLAILAPGLASAAAPANLDAVCSISGYAADASLSTFAHWKYDVEKFVLPLVAKEAGTSGIYYFDGYHVVKLNSDRTVVVSFIQSTGTNDVTMKEDVHLTISARLQSVSGQIIDRETLDTVTKDTKREFPEIRLTDFSHLTKVATDKKLNLTLSPDALERLIDQSLDEVLPKDSMPYLSVSCHLK